MSMGSFGVKADPPGPPGPAQPPCPIDKLLHRDRFAENFRNPRSGPGQAPNRSSPVLETGQGGPQRLSLGLERGQRFAKLTTASV